MHLLLVRHGETVWNVQRRIQGWTNSDLTERGRQQIARLGERLLSIPLTAAYVSDSIRTQETGQAAISGRCIPFEALSELRETSWGKWEGKTSAEISAVEPELWSKFVKRGNEDPRADQADWEATTLVPGGETIREASQRINACIDKIIGSHQAADDWVLVVGHGGSLRFVIASLLRMRPADAKLFHLDNASLTHITIDHHRTVLKLLNDIAHYSEGLLS